MNITRKQREELNELSIKVFRTSSKWQKYVKHGWSIEMIHSLMSDVVQEGEKILAKVSEQAKAAEDQRMTSDPGSSGNPAQSD